MKERPRRNRFAEARLSGMLKAQSEGKTSNEELEAAAKNAEQKEIGRIGAKSEKMFAEFASKSAIIKSVINPNPWDDAHDAIDQWVVLIDGFNLPPLPVQIKSSETGVNVFKKGDLNKNIKPNRSFTNLDGLMIVVNCGPSVKKQEDFNGQLMREAGRIVRILKTDPSSLKKLYNITPNRLKT